MEASEPPHRLRSQQDARTLWEVAGDVIAAALLGLVVWDRENLPGLGAAVVLAAALGCVALRHRAPVPSMVGATTAAVVAGFCWDDVGAFAIVVFALAQLCLLSVALHRDRKAALVAAAILALALLAQSLYYAQRHGTLDLRGLLYLTWTAAVVGTGLAVRSQRDYVNSLEARHREGEEEREREVTRRVTQERLRIARDLHDSVAHNISVISIHAGSAERTMQSCPADATTSLTAIRRATRTVLGEMQQILQVLRTEETPDTTVPGMAAVPDLLATLRRSGLQIWYAQDPSHLELPQAVDVTVYRFLQEALTNAARYSDGTAHVKITRSPRHLDVSVQNRTRSTHAPNRTSGYGLIGMRERVTSAGGDLRITELPSSFTVVATFPLTATLQPSTP